VAGHHRHGALARREDRRRRNSPRRKGERTHRPRDILDLLLTQIIEFDRKLVADLVVDSARDAKPARLTKRLQPRGDVHAVAENVARVDDDVTDIDANAKRKPLLFWHRLVAGRVPALHRDRARDGFHGAREFHEHAVTRRLDDATAPGGDFRVDQFLAAGLQCSKRADFIGTHQSAVADDVGCQNGGEPALYRLLSHLRPGRCYGADVAPVGGIPYDTRRSGDSSPALMKRDL
jgi:hypothetical protein